jgi:hypothetical protein
MSPLPDIVARSPEPVLYLDADLEPIAPARFWVEYLGTGQHVRDWAAITAAWRWMLDDWEGPLP